MDILKKISKIIRQTAETLSDAFNVVRTLENREEMHKWCKWIRSEIMENPTM